MQSKKKKKIRRKSNDKMLRNFYFDSPEHFLKTLGTFSKISRNISKKLSELFPKSLGTFPKNSRNFYFKLQEHFWSAHFRFSRTIKGILSLHHNPFKRKGIKKIKSISIQKAYNLYFL